MATRFAEFNAAVFTETMYRALTPAQRLKKQYLLMRLGKYDETKYIPLTQLSTVLDFINYQISQQNHTSEWLPLLVEWALLLEFEQTPVRE